MSAALPRVRSGDEEPNQALRAAAAFKLPDLRSLQSLRGPSCPKLKKIALRQHCKYDGKNCVDDNDDSIRYDLTMTTTKTTTTIMMITIKTNFKPVAKARTSPPPHSLYHQNCIASTSIKLYSR